MKKNLSPFVAASLLAAFTLTSCETPVGQGAAIGAGTGAVIGGLSRNSVRGAAGGAAIGAVGGALIGALVQEDERRNYGRPSGGYPVAQPTATPGFVYSPYRQGAIVDVRGIPRGALVRDPYSGSAFVKP